MNFSTFLTIVLLVGVSDAKKGKKEGPTSKSKGSAKKKGSGQCALPKDNVLEGVLIGVVATLVASPCAADTAKALCGGVATALDRCNDERKSCFCELAPSELVKSFDLDSCAAELNAMQGSSRRELNDQSFWVFNALMYWWIIVIQYGLAEYCGEGQWCWDCSNPSKGCTGF